MKIRQLILCASAVYAQGADVLREAYEGNYAFFLLITTDSVEFAEYNLVWCVYY